MSTTQLNISIDAVISTLAEIVARRGDDRSPPAVTSTTRLAELGLDSLEVVELFLALEGLAGCELEPPSKEWDGTVADLLAIRPAADVSEV